MAVMVEHARRHVEWFGPERGVQALMMVAFVSLLFVVPRQTARVLAGPSGVTTRRGELLTVDDLIADIVLPPVHGEERLHAHSG